MKEFRYIGLNLLFSVLSWLSLSAGPLYSEAYHKTPRTSIRIVSESTHITPGRPFQAGILFDLEPEWHIYWQNPGDAGLAPELSWRLPDGFSAGKIQWPYPETIFLGGLANFGYEGEVLLPVEITPPQEISTNAPVVIGVRAEWLICKEECIPESAELDLELPVKNTPPVADPRWQEIFNHAREKLPLKNIGWEVSAVFSDTTITLGLNPPDWYDGTPGKIRFYPVETNIIDNAADQETEAGTGRYILTVERNRLSGAATDTLSGVLVSENGWRGAGSERAIYFETPAERGVNTSELGFFWAVLFAFTGGLILNLMPCVLPVLSLKILGFMQQGGEDRRRIFYHGLVFTAGVMLSFLILAGILILLQTGGAQLGWGFQLQSPQFIFILSLFFFLFALNLFGVFEIGTSVMGIGQRTAGKGGWIGSFVSGVTATIVATPCTAPFMGSALGYAITQTPGVSLTIFAALGFGMAFPYLLISGVPGLLRFIPRPGPWMETLKQIMGFLLAGTVIWLIWVFDLQTGPNGILLILTALLLTALGGWIAGRWGAVNRPAGSRRIAWVSGLVLIGIVVIMGIRFIPAMAATTVVSQEKDRLAWTPYSEETYQTLRREGTPFLIDFTAAWCLSCQVNEQVAFGSEAVIEKITGSGIALLKADWTKKDPEITRALAKYGRNSVPLYVVYGGNGKEPVLLPEILTPAIVLESLENID